MTGKLIVFEGLDGSGKSYQSKRIVQMFNDNGIKTIGKRFPSTTNVGNTLKSLANTQSERGLSGQEAMSLARLALLDLTLEGLHFQRILASGTNIVCDRYVLSCYAYNLASFSVISIIDDILQSGHPFVNPHLTIFLRVPLELAVHRISLRKEKLTTKILQYANTRFELAIPEIPDLIVLDSSELSLHRIDAAVDSACVNLLDKK